MESNRLTIGVMGWWHYGNQGDLALLENMTRAWTPHHIVPIDLPCPFHEDLLERLNLLDFLILGGGGLFQGTLPPPFDTFDTWGRQLETPIGVAGVGVDQVLIEYRFLMTALIEQARFFYVRDPVSQQLLGHPKVRVVPDLTFLYPLKATTSTGTLDPPVCGVNLRRVPGLEVDRWIEVLRGLPVRLRGIPFSTYGVWREVQILRQLDRACATAFDPGLYAGLDLMVGTAFHSIVFAIQAAVPVIAIAYAPKVRRLMMDIGLEDYLLGLREWRKLPELVERTLDERSRLVDYLRETTTAMMRSARQAMANMREEIERTARRCPRSGPRVSIVVVGTASDTANQSTLASCLDQTYEDVEVIFVGEDAEMNVKAVSSRHELQLVAGTPAEGLGERLNRAFAYTTGEYLSWTAGGSLYARDAISCMANRLQRESACDMVYTDYYTIRNPNLIADVYPVDSAHKLFRRNVVGPCFLYRRKLAEEVGFYGTDTPLAAYDYWLRACRLVTLQPMHTQLFFALTANLSSTDPQEERQVRRYWRSTKPWLLRGFWSVVDTDLAERLVIRPLVTALRKIRALLQCPAIRSWIVNGHRAVRTSLVRTDLGRWRRVARESPPWDDRNRLIAGMIPGNSSVLDLGSGAQTLRKLLRPGCEYKPCDIVRSSDNVLVCDFNAGVYPVLDTVYDYVVCSGILEYMRHPHEFLTVAASLGKEMLVTYATFQEGDSRLRRAAEGWVNHLTRSELEGLFDTLGLRWSTVSRWNGQVVYRIWRDPQKARPDQQSQEASNNED
jgi:polysaccharide pyruvyl transferase WcaK-like protein